MTRETLLPFQKRLALECYYHLTLPYRRWRAWQRNATGLAPAMVLFYHRIADFHLNDWTTTNRIFARQISWLERHFDLVSLAEAQRRIACGHNERACVSITFDDGYADNCEQALPLLLSKKIPFTYFVATRNILEGQPFPHDLARDLPLNPNTPDQIRELADAGVEVGVHTRTHPNLRTIRDPEQLFDEVVNARDELEALIGRRPRYFAFPYGHHVNLTNASFLMARENGYDGVCSAYGGYNFPGDDPFHLQRIHPDNDLIRLKNWLTVDPRKIKQIRRFVVREVAIPSPPMEAGV